jgi:hypothetical protein
VWSSRNKHPQCINKDDLLPFVLGVHEIDIQVAQNGWDSSVKTDFLCHLEDFHPYSVSGEDVGPHAIKLLVAFGM